jgi:hypothetical protein
MTRSEYIDKYNEFEKKYNPYPVQMSRAEAFSKALHDGLITEEEYRQAHEYAGNLWFYTGD